MTVIEVIGVGKDVHFNDKPLLELHLVLTTAAIIETVTATATASTLMTTKRLYDSIAMTICCFAYQRCSSDFSLIKIKNLLLLNAKQRNNANNLQKLLYLKKKKGKSDIKKHHFF